MIRIWIDIKTNHCILTLILKTPFAAENLYRDMPSFFRGAEIPDLSSFFFDCVQAQYLKP
jgi:hypothetical protein